MNSFFILILHTIKNNSKDKIKLKIIKIIVFEWNIYYKR